MSSLVQMSVFLLLFFTNRTDFYKQINEMLLLFALSCDFTYGFSPTWMCFSLSTSNSVLLCLTSFLNKAPAGGFPNYYPLGKDHSSVPLYTHMS